MDAPRPSSRDITRLPVSEPVVRVRVRRVREAGTALRLGSDGQRLLLTDPDAPATNLLLAAPVSISLGPRGWSVEDAAGFQPQVGVLEPITLRQIDEDESVLALDDERYPGFFSLTPRTDLKPGAVDVVNHVMLESYLPGVVAGEIFRHWHEQTHAAQAVAARSFACAEHAFWRGRRHFDLSDTASSQMYTGLTSRQRALEAVAGTRGEVLAFEGRLVPGYYSSCCGGLAARAVDVISTNPVNDTPPLHGRAGEDLCTAAPVYQWSITRTATDLRRRLRAFGDARGEKDLAALGRVRSIQPAKVNTHGRPVRYAITDRSQRTVEIGAEDLLAAANYAGNGIKRPKRRLLSSFVAVTTQWDQVQFAGRGFGHGAGMCQYGAEALAKEGRTYHEILQWYYPQVRMARAYE